MNIMFVPVPRHSLVSYAICCGSFCVKLFDMRGGCLFLVILVELLTIIAEIFFS